MEAVDIEFAEEARIACSKALVKFATGQQEAAIVILTQFGEKCANIVQGAKMEQEQTDMRADRFSLAALRVDLGARAPERDDEDDYWCGRAGSDHSGTAARSVT